MNFPHSFVSSLPRFITKQDLLIETLQTESPVSIRINKRKQEITPSLQQVPWCNEGVYLNQRPVFTLDPLLHAGAFYVQEASSMFLAHAINSLPDLVDNPRILDLCAAPGGKTTLLSNFLGNAGVLVANEITSTRVGALSENVQKWGNANVIVTNSDAATLGTMNHAFDVIVCDAPCSGEGMFRKDSEAIAHWNEAAVLHCAERQRDIVTDIWSALCPGGYFIYSTCTFNEAENEQIVAYLIETFGAESIKLSLNAEWGVQETEINNAVMYRFLPHQVRGEGFALAVLQKPNDEVTHKSKRHLRNTKQWAAAPKIVNATMQQWFSSEISFLQSSFNELRGLTPLANEFLNILPPAVRVIHAGIDVAEIKNKDFIPLHGVAMSPDLLPEIFPRCELSLQKALQYLHRDSILLDAAFPKSWIMLTYKNTPLGFVKNLGNRTNNNYPQEWRIRMNIDKE